MEIFDDLMIRGGFVQNKNQLQLFKNLKFSMYPARAFAILLNRLHNDKGLDYIKKLGKIMGENSAKNLAKELKKFKKLIKKDYQTIPNLIEISGFGKIDSFTNKENEIIIIIKDHPVIKNTKELYQNKSLACEFYAEIYKQYLSIIGGYKNIKIKHLKCISKGDDSCEWHFKYGTK